MGINTATMTAHRLCQYAASESNAKGELMWIALSRRWFMGKDTEIRPIRLDSREMRLNVPSTLVSTWKTQDVFWTARLFPMLTSTGRSRRCTLQASIQSRSLFLKLMGWPRVIGSQDQSRSTASSTVEAVAKTL